VFIPGKPFQPSLMYSSKAAVAYLSEATLVQAPGLTLKHYTRLERPVSDKRSSLLLTFVNCGFENFYNICTRCTKTSVSSRRYFTSSFDVTTPSVFMSTLKLRGVDAAIKRFILRR
jgi:hypothetical protein